MLTLHPAIPRFLTPAHTVFGAGSVAGLRSITAARVAVVARHQRSFDLVSRHVQAPVVQWVKPSWDGEPSLPALRGAASEIEQLAPDWIVAVGGGGVIDGAKLLWVLYEAPNTSFEPRGGVVPLPRFRSKARFAALPTTAGSGSESSSAAVITDSVTGRKVPCVSQELLPDLAVLDPRLMDGVPTAAIGFSAVDAMTHAIEGFTSRTQNAFVDAFVPGVVRAISEALTPAMQGDEPARLRLLLAASQAGLVQNHRIPGAAHAMAHQLGVLGIPHGAATGVLLTHVIRHNAQTPAVAAMYDTLAVTSGLAADVNGLHRHLVGLLASAGLSTSLRNFTALPSGAALDRMVEGAQADVCMRNNAVPLSAEDVFGLLEAAWQ